VRLSCASEAAWCRSVDVSIKVTITAPDSRITALATRNTLMSVIERSMSEPRP